MDSTALTAFLGSHPPFDGLMPEDVGSISAAAKQVPYAQGELILDAFTDASTEVFVLLSGLVNLWNDADGLGAEPDEILGVGEVFGFSAMLTERSIGPRAVARTPTLIARIPGDSAAVAFASRRGATFLANRMFAALRSAPGGAPSFASVADLIAGPPLVVEPHTSVADVARQMTDRHSGYAVVRLRDAAYGLVTDASIRTGMVALDRPGDTRVDEVLADRTPSATVGDSAAETLIRMVEADADHVLVLDRSQGLQGVVTSRDFSLSPSAADVVLHEQLRRAATPDELVATAGRIPALLGDLLSRGLASGRVIAVNSLIIDAMVRRSLELVLDNHPELSRDAFTWMSLGSNGRREAVLTSDIDSAVAFAGSPNDPEIAAHLVAFGEIHALLARAGLSSDEHGASASRRAFARTNPEWREAALAWLGSPVDGQGAIMTSLLVDGRPIYGDPGLPAVTAVFTELRKHPGTMRLLLQDSLARRARLHTPRALSDLLTRRPDSFDIKSHALLPIVNIGRWAALSVGSSALPTVERLGAASGSAMLPAERAATLVEVFEVLQRLRLRYQLLQVSEGQQPSDALMVGHMSPIDRSIIAQAVREIASAQKRMSNISAYLPAEEWTRPEGR